MSDRGNEPEWGSEDWGDTTGHYPDNRQGWAEARGEFDQQWWSAGVDAGVQESPAGSWRTGAMPPGSFAADPASGPSPGASSNRRTLLLVSGVLVAILVIGGLAVAAFFALGRDSGARTVADGWSEEPGSGQASESGPGDQARGEGATAQDPSAGSAQVSPSGTYVGILSQRGTVRSDLDYPVEMTFSPQGATVGYPTLGCSGILTPTGESSGAAVFREIITSGPCDPAGTWYVTTGSERALSAEYHPSRGDYVVVGRLTR